MTEQGDDIIKKRIVIAVILSYLLGLLQIMAGAQGITVGSQDVAAVPGDSIRLPITISNHSGIMGFKISVEYPPDILSNPKVMRGAVTTQGMFADSISSSGDNSFDIVWSGVSDVTEDGVLFILQFEVADTAKAGTYPIKLAYSQPDTFNEEWEDVVLDVTGFNVLIESDEGSEALTPPIEDSDNQETQGSSDKVEDSEGFIEEVKDKVDGEYIQDIITDALQDVGSDHVQDMDESQFQQFEAIVNGAFDDYGVIIENKPADKQAYDQLFSDVVAENFTDEVLDIIDEETVIAIVEDVLGANDADSIDQLKEDDVNQFADAVFNALEEHGMDCGEYKSPAIDRIQLIDKLCDEVGLAPESNTAPFRLSIVFIAIILALIAVGAFVLICVFKRKGKK